MINKTYVYDIIHHIAEIRDKYNPYFGSDKEKEVNKLCCDVIFMLNNIVEGTTNYFGSDDNIMRMLKFLRYIKIKFLLTLNVEKYIACKDAIYLIEKYFKKGA